MCRMASAGLHRWRKIIPLRDFIRGVLQHAGDQTDHVGRVHGEVGGSCSTEVVETHGLSELLESSRADNVVDASGAERASPIRRPKPVMLLAATEQPGADLFQIAQEIGEELILRYPEAFGTLRLGVLRIEKHVRPDSIELDMSAEGKGRNAAATDQPKGEQGNDKAVTILEFSLLVAVTRGQGDCFFH